MAVGLYEFITFLSMLSREHTQKVMVYVTANVPNDKKDRSQQMYALNFMFK